MQRSIVIARRTVWTNVCFNSRFFFLITFLLLGLSATGQQKGTVVGVIQDDQGEVVPFTTVILLNKDSVYAAGAISEADGTFQISAAPSTYQVQVQNIEFETYQSEFFTVTSGQRVSLAPIQLKSAVKVLGDVVITAEKQLVEIHPDKMVFNVASSVNASGNNGLELLSKAPGVLIDPDNNIVLQGKTGVRIFINGRPSRLSGTDLATMLQSMQSDNIESIEIITNPSAKYEAEGNAGIINIILKKNPNQGTNGNFVTSISKGDYWRNNVGLSLNTRGEKVTVYGDVTRFDNDFQSDFTDTKLQSGYELNQESLGVNQGEGYNFSAGIDYVINRKHSLALFGRGISNSNFNRTNSQTSIQDLEGGVPTEILVAGSLADGTSQNKNFNLNYIFNISKTANLSSDLSYGDFSNESETSQPNTYFQADGETVNSEVNNSFNSATDIDLWSYKIDYEKRFDKIMLSAGGKYAYINTTNSFQFFNIESSGPVLDTDRSNDFNYTEKVAALYVILNAPIGEKLKLNTGLRMEHTQSRGRLLTETTVDNRDVIREYTDLFPNVGLSYSDNKNINLNVGVGRRISRPNYQDLNPFENKLSELSYFKGNPFLNPNYIMNYQFSFSYKNRLVISNTYSVTSDYFANILQIVDEKATFLTPQNMDKITSNGLSVSYPITFSKWWEASTFVNYNYSTFDGNIDGTLIDITIHTYNYRIQNNFSLPANVTVDLSFFHNSPFIWRGSIQIEAIDGLNLGVRKDFFKQKLQVRLTANDIFNGNSDYFYSGNYGGLNIDGFHGVDNRRYGVGLTYKFGNQKVRSSKKKSALEDEMNRISN